MRGGTHEDVSETNEIINKTPEFTFKSFLLSFVNKERLTTSSGFAC